HADAREKGRGARSTSTLARQARRDLFRHGLLRLLRGTVIGRSTALPVMQRGGPHRLGLLAVTDRGALTSTPPDPLVNALVRYVEALDRQYPAGPQQIPRKGLDSRSNMPRMRVIDKDPAA